jgi:hypothetical protein
MNRGLRTDHRQPGRSYNAHTSLRAHAKGMRFSARLMKEAQSYNSHGQQLEVMLQH